MGEAVGWEAKEEEVIQDEEVGWEEEVEEV